MDDLYNFCFCCLLDGGTEKIPLTLPDAEYEIACMRDDFPEIIEGITPEQFMTVWNETLSCLNGSKES